MLASSDKGLSDLLISFRCSQINNGEFPVFWLGSGLANLMEVLTVKKVMLWHSLSVSLHEIRRLFYKNKQSYVGLVPKGCEEQTVQDASITHIILYDSLCRMGIPCKFCDDFWRPIPK